jgi:hypothetical protein
MADVDEEEIKIDKFIREACDLYLSNRRTIWELAVELSIPGRCVERHLGNYPHDYLVACIMIVKDHYKKHKELISGYVFCSQFIVALGKVIPRSQSTLRNPFQ